MKITAVETFRVAAYGNFVWLRIETDEGLVGIGEAFRNPEATEAYVHETCAPYLLGKDPLQVTAHHHALLSSVGSRFQGYPSRSVEIRGNSAVDVALWDILGKSMNQPLHAVFGGLCHDKLRIYNTCAGYGYNTANRADRNVAEANLDAPPPPRDPNFPYEDLEAQTHRCGELAQELLDQGVTAMKIWPFDPAAKLTAGRDISAATLRQALKPLEALRAAVGDKMDVMIEYHSLWRLAPALKIAREADAFGIYWHEDPIEMHRLEDLAEFRSSVDAPIAGSENHGSAVWYRDALAARAIDYMHFDLGWIGGLTEARKIAALGSAWDRMIAPHDCTGPIQLAANIHVSLASPNTLILETVRAYLNGFYQEIIAEPLPIRQGFAYPMTGPGLGVEFHPELLARSDLTRRRSTL